MSTFDNPVCKLSERSQGINLCEVDNIDTTMQNEFNILYQHQGVERYTWKGAAAVLWHWSIHPVGQS